MLFIHYYILFFKHFKVNCHHQCWCGPLQSLNLGLRGIWSGQPASSAVMPSGLAYQQPWLLGASSTLLPRQGARQTLLSSTTGVGHGQFFHSHDTGTSSPACHRWWGMREERRVTSPSRQEARLLHSCPQAGSFATPPLRASSTVMPRWSTGPALSSAAAGEGQGQLSCSNDLWASSPACHCWQGGRGSRVISSSPMSLHGGPLTGPVLQRSHPQG